MAIITAASGKVTMYKCRKVGERKQLDQPTNCWIPGKVYRDLQLLGVCRDAGQAIAGSKKITGSKKFCQGVLQAQVVSLKLCKWGVAFVVCRQTDWTRSRPFWHRDQLTKGRSGANPSSKNDSLGNAKPLSVHLWMLLRFRACRSEAYRVGDLRSR